MNRNRIITILAAALLSMTVANVASAGNERIKVDAPADPNLIQTTPVVIPTKTGTIGQAPAAPVTPEQPEVAETPSEPAEAVSVPEATQPAAPAKSSKAPAPAAPETIEEDSCG